LKASYRRGSSGGSERRQGEAGRSSRKNAGVGKLVLGDMSSGEENSTNHTEEEEQGKESKVEGKASNMPDVSFFFLHIHFILFSLLSLLL
jgi:hypothetical protein